MLYYYPICLCFVYDVLERRAFSWITLFPLSLIPYYEFCIWSHKQTSLSWFTPFLLFSLHFRVRMVDVIKMFLRTFSESIPRVGTARKLFPLPHFCLYVLAVAAPSLRILLHLSRLTLT
ncbi:hypothetical protein BGW80DRAFT_1378925 [Lactifluus volemus]|nr:hypothetical protein BGW80DRAFT_1378925 [Lactifluus volemus]